jgi:hypothetical protein
MCQGYISRCTTEILSFWWRSTKEKELQRKGTVSSGLLGRVASRRWRSLREPQLQQWRSNQRFKRPAKGQRRERYPALLERDAKFSPSLLRYAKAMFPAVTIYGAEGNSLRRSASGSLPRGQRRYRSLGIFPHRRGGSVRRE